MHNRITGRVAAAISAALLATALTACTAADIPPASNYAVIVPVHANGPVITEQAATVVLDQIVESENYYLAYTSESKPQQLFGKVVSYDQSSNSGSGPRDAAIAELASLIQDAGAVSAENDPLEAITLAAAQLKRRDGESTILVLDNLLQTSGGLALQNGTIYSDPHEVVDQLTAKGYLPDLAGVSIVLAQTGVVPPGTDQEQLNSVAIGKLETLWVTILEATGAEVTLFGAEAGSDPVSTDQPMTPVPVEPLVPVQAGCMQGLPDSVVEFEADTANFLDEDAAELAITRAVEQLRASGCGGGLTVIGTTSSAGTAASREHVATIRSAAVAGLLAAALSIDVAEIHTVAAGYDERYCAHDRDELGRLVPELAAACRQVIISIEE
jgi:hypothetical protein